MPHTTAADECIIPEVSYDRNWCRADLTRVPHLLTQVPGPNSHRMHQATSSVYKGLSGQVKLFPVCWSKGSGVTLEDVDGNRYLDFSSGIYVTTFGHCHPKVSEATA